MGVRSKVLSVLTEDFTELLDKCSFNFGATKEVFLDAIDFSTELFFSKVPSEFTNRAKGKRLSGKLTTVDVDEFEESHESATGSLVDKGDREDDDARDDVNEICFESSTAKDIDDFVWIFGSIDDVGEVLWDEFREVPAETGNEESLSLLGNSTGFSIFSDSFSSNLLFCFSIGFPFSDNFSISALTGRSSGGVCCLSGTLRLVFETGASLSLCKRFVVCNSGGHIAEITCSGSKFLQMRLGFIRFSIFLDSLFKPVESEEGDGTLLAREEKFAIDVTGSSSMEAE